MYFKPVSKDALSGEKVVRVEYGPKPSCDAPHNPYSVYLLVMESGKVFRVGELCGEIMFSVGVEDTLPSPPYQSYPESYAFSIFTAEDQFLGYQREGVTEAHAVRLWNERLPGGYPKACGAPHLAGKRASRASWGDTSDGAGYREG